MLDGREDERGSFARLFCREEFAAHGLETQIDQCNASFNRSAGTLRGLHFQRSPYGETKVVRCHRGRIWDVLVDLREKSPTAGQWYAQELSEANHCMLYIPRGFAHGFQTLENDSEIFYAMFDAYVPGAASGIRWNDESLSIDWPLRPSLMSDQDANLPSLEQVRVEEKCQNST